MLVTAPHRGSDGGFATDQKQQGRGRHRAAGARFHRDGPVFPAIRESRGASYRNAGPIRPGAGIV
jgi:hypothetical protein